MRKLKELVVLILPLMSAPRLKKVYLVEHVLDYVQQDCTGTSWPMLLDDFKLTDLKLRVHFYS